ncbi:MAG: ATP-dependent zinc metalloprotease FtsH [Peptococcaceae bacterium]|nr:ATP-dependent zinc metalloprotease FtsH [Peptococcaceae bacterium]
MKNWRNWTFYIVLALLAVLFFYYVNGSKSKPEEVSFTDMTKYIEENVIDSIKATPNGALYNYDMKMKDGADKKCVGPRLTDDMQNKVTSENGTPLEYKIPTDTSWLYYILISVLLLGVVAVFFFFMMNQSQGGGGRVMQFGKSRAKMIVDEKKATFRDVAGADEVKEELEEIVEFLKSPRKFTEIGAKIPKGVLLFGPPGTGKTLLARAVSGEAGVPFFSISGSDFVEMFVGVGASRVRDLFEQAKKNSPCIVFIDEIDAVGRQRGAGLGGGHDEREQTLNQLLVEMDGFSGNEGIIIIAATNRPDILDPALLRPGRFDRQVVVSLPDVRGREEILQVHVQGKPLSDDVDLAVLARRTSSFTGADLANLVNEAALLTARKNEKKIPMRLMEDSIERVIAGPEKKSRVISESEKRLVAYHEAGHALLGQYLPHSDPVHKVSIIPRGRAGGYTLLLPEEDSNYRTRTQLLDNVTVFMGGRVAEALVLQEVSTGASSDLEQSTNMVRRMVMEFGMSEELGPLTFGHKEEQVFLGRDIARDRNYSEAVAQTIDSEVRRIVDECYQSAQDIITDKIDCLHAIAQALIEKETLDVKEFQKIIAQFEDGVLVSDVQDGDDIEADSPVPEGIRRLSDKAGADSDNDSSGRGKGYKKGKLVIDN